MVELLSVISTILLGLSVVLIACGLLLGYISLCYAIWAIFNWGAPINKRTHINVLAIGLSILIFVTMCYLVGHDIISNQRLPFLQG